VASCTVCDGYFLQALVHPHTRDGNIQCEPAPRGHHPELLGGTTPQEKCLLLYLSA
jgi:hypothetical protein